MPASVVDYQQNDIAQQFKDQKAAMIVIGPWEFADFNSTKGLELGSRLHPGPEGGHVARRAARGRGLGHPEDDAGQRGARAQALAVPHLSGQHLQLGFAKR